MKLDGPTVEPLSGNTKSIVVFFHGYGANGNDLISLSNAWQDVLPDTKFYSPDAPFKCDFGVDSYQWFDLIERNEEEIKRGLLKIKPIVNQYLDEIILENEISESNMCIVGFSQGTIMALYHLTKRQKPCAGLIGYSGMLFNDQEFEKTIQCKFPILLYHGKNDPVISYQSSMEAKENLRKFGFEVECIIQNNLEHGIDINGLSQGKVFLDKVLNV